jgi:hypothetical protein
MSLIQDKRYGPNANQYYDVQYNNIKTIGGDLIVDGDIIIEGLPVSTTNTEFVTVDGTNRLYKQVATPGGGGDVVGGNISQDGGVVIYNGVSGKLLKSQSDITISGSPGVYTLQNGKTRVNTYDLGFFDPDTGRIGHNLGTVQNTEGERFGLCMGGSYDGLVIANQAICYVWIYEYGSLLLRRKINCVAGTIYDPLTDFEAVQTFGNFGMSADVPLRIDYDKLEASYDRILCLDGSNFMRERDLSINPWYNQDLNTTADVNFNNGTFNNIFSQAQTTNILLSTSPQITAFIPMRFKQLCEFQSNCDFTLAGICDFTGCTVLGLPASGDVSSSIAITDNNSFCRFDGVTGKLIKNSISTLSDTGAADFERCTASDGIFSNINTFNIFNNDIGATVGFSSHVNFNGNDVGLANSEIDLNNATFINSSLVSGPISTVDHSLTRFNGTDGSLVQGSGVTLTDTNDMSNLNNIISQNLTLNNLASNNAENRIVVIENITNKLQVRDVDTIISSLSSVGIGGGESLVSDGLGPSLAVKGLVGGTSITVSSNATDVTVSAPLVVNGPFLSTDHNIVRYDGSSGKLVQDSGITISDSNNMFGIGVITAQNATLTALTSNPGSDQVLVKNSLTNQIQIRDATTIGGDLSSNINSSINRSICVFADTSGKLVTETALASITVGGNMFAQTIETSGATFNSSLQSVTVNNFQNSAMNLTGTTINATDLIIENVIGDVGGVNRSLLTLNNFNELEQTIIFGVYGGVYIESNAVITTIVTVNTWTSFDNLFTLLPEVSGISPIGQDITITSTQPGNCNLMGSVSIESQSSSFIQYEIGVFKNGVLLAGSLRRTSTTDGNEDKNLSSSTTVGYVVGDDFNLRIRNITDTTDILITNCSLTVTGIWSS